MNPARGGERIASINSALLAAMFFLIPTKITPVYALSALVLVLWTAEGRWQHKWHAVRGNTALWLVQATFWLYLVATLWSPDPGAGFSMSNRYLLFAIAPLYFTVAQRAHTTRYVAAFAAGVLACETLAAYNWLQLHHYPAWPVGFLSSKDALETAPFVDRIMFGPIVAFASYVCGWYALHTRGARRWWWAGAAALAVAGLTISASRVGLVAAALLMALLTFQRLHRHRLLAAVASVVVCASVAVALYAVADHTTQQRVVEGVDELHDVQGHGATSIAQRYTMATNTLHIIAQHPLFGVGTGGFRSAYLAMNALRSPGARMTRNPHNEMLFAVASCGVAGGVLLLAMWFVPPWLWRRHDDGLQALRIALPLFFFAICFSESYLWLPNTGLMFVLFSALLYGPATGQST